jgi:hypothetical protein
MMSPHTDLALAAPASLPVAVGSTASAILSESPARQLMDVPLAICQETEFVNPGEPTAVEVDRAGESAVRS